MCTRIPARTYAKWANHRLRLEQLQAEGIDVDIPDSWQDSCPLIIEPGRQPGRVCDLGGGNTGFAISLRIVALARVILVDCEIASEWDDFSIDLAYLTETRGRYKLGSLDHPVDEVINDKFARGIRLNFRGDMIEGVLIAEGFSPVPENYQSETLVPVRITLLDSLNRVAITDLRLEGSLAKRDQTHVRSCAELQERAGLTHTNVIAGSLGKHTGSEDGLFGGIRHGRSIEQEAREAYRRSLTSSPSGTGNVTESIRHNLVREDRGSTQRVALG